VPDLISSNEAGGCNYLTLKIEGINVFDEKCIKNALFLVFSNNQWLQKIHNKRNWVK
jgi:hypothetical protein